MHCEQAETLLALLALGELEGERAADLEAHLADCPACRARLADLRATLQLLEEAVSRLPEAHLSAERRKALMEIAAAPSTVQPQKAASEVAAPAGYRPPIYQILPVMRRAMKTLDERRILTTSRLVEAAAALLIFAILVGLLMPALSASRHRARESSRAAAMHARELEQELEQYTGGIPPPSSAPAPSAPVMAGREKSSGKGELSPEGEQTRSVYSYTLRAEPDSHFKFTAEKPSDRRYAAAPPPPAPAKGTVGAIVKMPDGGGRQDMYFDGHVKWKDSNYASNAPGEIPAGGGGARAAGDTAAKADDKKEMTDYIAGLRARDQMAEADKRRVIEEAMRRSVESCRVVPDVRTISGLAIADAIPSGKASLTLDRSSSEVSAPDRGTVVVGGVAVVTGVEKQSELRTSCERLVFPEAAYQYPAKDVWDEVKARGGATPSEEARPENVDLREYDVQDLLDVANAGKVSGMSDSTDEGKKLLGALVNATGQKNWDDARVLGDQTGAVVERKEGQEVAGVGRIMCLRNGYLMVNHTGRVQKQIEDALSTMRKQTDASAAQDDAGTSVVMLGTAADVPGATFAFSEWHGPVYAIPPAAATPQPAESVVQKEPEQVLDVNVAGEIASATPLVEQAPPKRPAFKAGPVNPWVMATKDALSTFGIDVDTASYAIARNYIVRGSLPPAASVRMEEYVNAFDYNYPTQSRGVFSVHAEAGPSPFGGPGLTLLKIGVRARVLGREARKPAHLVFVVDASGSMEKADRMPLVKFALRSLVAKLDPQDRVSLVTFNTHSLIALEAAPASEQKKILGAVDSLACSGSTNLLEGLESGYQLAARNFIPGGINRVILCSDGIANIGDTDADAMLARVDAFRRQGVTFTAAGFGFGAYDDVLLERLADKGDGNYSFIDTEAEARRVFVEGMAATLQTVAADAKIQVSFDPARVRRYRLIGFENRDIADEDFRNDTVDAGEVGSGQSSTALYELELLPPDEATESAADIGAVFVRYRNVETGRVEEISQPLGGGIVLTRTVEDSPRFYLAACAAQFAEILRGSEHARNGSLSMVRPVIQSVAAELPLDSRVQELAELVRRADGLPRAE